MLLRVGTRGSKLSLIQTDLVIAQLKKARPDLRVEKRIIRTTGDQDQKTPLYFLDQKGVFEKEVDEAILNGTVDFGIHSMKDIPVFENDTDLAIAGVPDRGPPADVLLTRKGQKLENLASGSRVGTSSLLRSTQLRRVRPDLETAPIRGNVDTRIRKVEEGQYDAVILAEAGLVRLGLTAKVAERLSLKDFYPAPGQGLLAALALRDNRRVIELLKVIDHPLARAQAEAERELVRVLGGGCKVPIGALATCNEDHITLGACVLSFDGRERLESTQTGPIGEPVEVARKVASQLFEQGAKKLEQEWRNYTTALTI